MQQSNIFIYIENFKFKEHIIYSFESLFRCICKNHLVFNTENDKCVKKYDIYYGNNAPKEFIGMVIREGDLFSDIYLSKDSVPKTPILRFNDLPILFFDKKSNFGIIEDDKLLIINLDIVQSTFFFLSGYEEIVNKDLLWDVHSRYIANNRVLFKECNYKRAIVNEYAELLLDFCNRQNVSLYKRKNESYAHISHDVDIPYFENFIIKIINKIIKKNLKSNYLFNFLDHGFHDIIKIEKKYNIKSCWYFMTSDNTLSINYGYDLNEKKLSNLISKIVNKGDEIGYHYSYNASFDEHIFKKEVNKFSKLNLSSFLCGRNHYLRYTIPYSFRLYAEHGIFYDASLSSAQHEGFIYGICTPFELFDAILGKNLHVWEIPLLIMDGTLFDKKYMHYNSKQAQDSIEYYINEVIRHNGVFSILWHNSSLTNKNFKKFNFIYFDSMKKISNSLKCLVGRDIIKEYNFNV